MFIETDYFSFYLISFKYILQSTSIPFEKRYDSEHINSVWLFVLFFYVYESK